MSIQEPAWLKRTRPCPFFSQGRCLFADSCNFLHDVKVRNAQPLPSATFQVKQSYFPPKPVFDLPSVVVNSASPRSVDLASPEGPASFVQDSSRYSGLLSVLSDIIGPPSDLPMETEQVPSNRAELSSISEPNSEDTLVDPFGHKMEPFFPGVDDEPVTEFLPVPGDEEFTDTNATSYFAEGTEPYVIESEVEESEDEDEDEDEEYMDDHTEDPTMMVSNRQSTLSSFTGASLLATPRNSVFGESSVTIPVGDSAVNLLSPVQLSAMLRPFPIPSLGAKVKRGDSIDSGYADGDSWVSPLPFPCSPPRSFRSPVTFLSHPWRASYSSPALQDRRASCNVGALRPSSCHPIGVIKEVKPEPEESCGPLQVNVSEGPEIPVMVMHSLRQCPEHLHPTREYDPDSCSQLSFVSDDNVSFKTALSTQPSYDGLSDISKISPVKHDSLLSSISGCSAPNTSVLLRYGGANELSQQPVVSSCVCESSYLVFTTGMAGQIDRIEIDEAGALEECSLPEEIPINSNILFTSASADDLQGLSPAKVIAPQVPLSGVCRFDRYSLVSSPSVDTSHNLSSAKDILALGAGQFAPEKVVTPQERLFGAFHFDKRPPKSSPSAEISYSVSIEDTCGHAPSSTDDLQEIALEDVAPQEHSLGTLHYDRRSPRSNSSTEGSYNPPLCKDVHSYGTAGVGDVPEFSPEDDIALQKRLSGVLHLDKHSPNQSSLAESSGNPSSVQDILGYPVPGASDPQEFPPENVVTQEHLSGVLHFDKDKPSPKSSSSAKGSPSSSSVKDVLDYAPPDADGNGSRCMEPSPTDLHGSLAECFTAEAGQSLVVENNPESYDDSECDNSIQRLPFPLPPLFVQVESVRHSTLTEDTSILPQTLVMDLEKDVSDACIVLQHEGVQRIPLRSDPTEKAMPSRPPSAGPPASDLDFTLQRSRAASDLTVKGRSPIVTTPGDNPYVLGSSPPPLEQPGRSDSVQSLYDQYFDDGISDSGSELSSPAHIDTAPLGVSSPSEEAPQDVSVDHISHVFYRVSSPFSDGKTSNSGVDSPRSETALRPLLTGERSFVRSSLAELIPRADLVNIKESSFPMHPSNRLQVREIGSTVVSLGFRRRKPQPAATQPLRSTPEPVLPVSKLREVLRIRTDIAKEDSPPGCSSAIHLSSTIRSPLSMKPMSAPPTSGLRQLRLSSIINKRSSALSTQSSSIASSILSIKHIFNSSTPQSPSVSSTTSFSRNSLFSSPRERIPEQIQHTPECSGCDSLILQDADGACSALQRSTRRDSRSVFAPIQRPKSWRLSHYRAGSPNYISADGTHRLSRRTSIFSLSCAVDEERKIDEHDPTISRRLMQSKHEENWAHPPSVLATPVHAIATPKPTLLFAIASDNVDQVRQVLESGEAGPNDSVGPQSALAFTLTNDKLAHKQEIVKALLAYGANASALRNPTFNPAPHGEGGDESSAPPPETTLEGMDPATRYFVARADAAHTRQTSQLIYRSCFRPLTRVRYDVIGQDWALEQLFRVLSMHSQKFAVAPIVVLLCGPSGHGKSLLARKFGSLLDVPTHTVNMTTLRSAHDIWQSYSMSPYEEPSSCTLAEFLIENEGKRCVVVLDEIEKVEDQTALWSLLMPWELGRCSLEAGKRHIDARSVIWLGTSNVGHELVFEHHENRVEPDQQMSREEYFALTGMLRPRVSHCLGASLLSRVTAVLPFVPFTLDEQKAIAAEAVYTLSSDACKLLSPQDVQSLVVKALPSYHPSEGARSLHRAISTILVDTI